MTDEEPEGKGETTVFRLLWVQIYDRELSGSEVQELFDANGDSSSALQCGRLFRSINTKSGSPYYAMLADRDDGGVILGLSGDESEQAAFRIARSLGGILSSR